MCETDYLSNLYRVIGIITYRGCLITPKDGKFYALRTQSDTLEEATKRIDKAFMNFKLF